MAEPKIPDRSTDPALQKSPDARPEKPADKTTSPPDAEEVEELTGVPAEAKDLGIV